MVKLTNSLTQEPDDDAAVVARGQLQADKKRIRLRVAEKHLSADVWNFRRHNGAHFPLSIQTKNPSRRSPTRYYGRRKEAEDKRWQRWDDSWYDGWHGWHEAQ